MKRSEMLELIKKSVNRQATCAYGADYLAEEILAQLEDAGMKPPLTKRCPVLLTDKHVWEKE